MYDFVIFLDVDWEATGQKNRQHFLIRELARQLESDSRILAVERPICPWTSLFRNREKLTQWIRGERGLRQVAANFYVYTPFVLIHNLIAAQISGMTIINRGLLRRVLRRMLKKLDFKDDLIAWIHHPYQLEDLGLIGEKYLIYDCYDEYLDPTNFKNVAKLRCVEENEKKILKKADIVLAVSEQIANRREKWNKNIYVLPNAADVEHFSLANAEYIEIPIEVRRIPKPIIGYVGTINERTDFQLVVHMANHRPHWSIVFVGPYVPQSKAFFSMKTFQEAKAQPNVYFLGMVPYERLPNYLKAFDVCIAPYSINEFNRSCSPVKIYEYLATGKPIVTTDLPGVRIFKEVIRIAADHNSFVEQIEEALRENNIELVKRRLAIAQLNSWDHRAETIINIIDAQLRK